jgi:uncharacterized protein YjiS (DUF1127 family)
VPDATVISGLPAAQQAPARVCAKHHQKVGEAVNAAMQNQAFRNRLPPPISHPFKRPMPQGCGRAATKLGFLEPDIMATNMANAYEVVGAASNAAGRNVLSRLVGSWREYRRYQRTLSELDGLTDRDLADIGLSRGEIAAVARRCARR